MTTGQHPKKRGLNAILAVPTRGYVWHETAKALEPFNPQYVREKISAANVRNKIVKDFLKTEADVLVMCDDDVIPHGDFLEILAKCPYDIVAAGVPVAKMPAHEVFINAFDVDEEGAFRTTELPMDGHKACDAVGTGLILIHRKVFEDPTMKMPFNQQLDDDGLILVGQDLQFCRRAREAGYTIGVSMDALCDHFVWLHANAITRAYHPEEE